MSWHIKDVIARVRTISADRLVTHRQQNEVSLSCGVGSTIRSRIERENEAISQELARRRTLDSDSLLRETAAMREIERRALQEAEQPCRATGYNKIPCTCHDGKPTLLLRFARSENHPFVAEVSANGSREVHRFGDSDQREAFVSGVRSFAKVLGLTIVEVDGSTPSKKRKR